MTDFDAVKEKQQSTWAAGDFSIVAWNTLYVGERLCEAADLRAGQKVLDVATGSGNTALSAARRFCDVTGIDYVPALIEKAKERARVDQLPATFQVGDCENLPFPDASFDVVLSTFGSMFAPNHEKTASEMLRVCRSGGTIALANWVPDGFWGEMFRLQATYIPHPEGLRPPGECGTESRLQELFGPAVESIKATPQITLFRFTSTEHCITFFKKYFGPVLKAYEHLSPEQQQAYQADIETLLAKYNQSGDSTLLFPGKYLEVVMKKK